MGLFFSWQGDILYSITTLSLKSTLFVGLLYKWFLKLRNWSYRSIMLYLCSDESGFLIKWVRGSITLLKANVHVTQQLKTCVGEALANWRNRIPSIFFSSCAFWRSRHFVRKLASSLWDPAILWNAKVPTLNLVEIAETGSPHNHCHFSALRSGKNSKLMNPELWFHTHCQKLRSLDWG